MTVYRFADGSTRNLNHGPELTILGLDAEGYVVVRWGSESGGPGFAMTYALTACCQASAKGCDGYIGCRSCYAEVDPKLGGDPDPIAHPVLPTPTPLPPAPRRAAPPKESTAMRDVTNTYDADTDTVTRTVRIHRTGVQPPAADQYRALGLTDETEWTPAMRLAIKQKWSGLPVDVKVDDLRAQIAAVTTADVPSVDDLVAQAFTRDEATVEHARLTRNAKVNAWRERGRLRAALEARELKFAKLRASGKKSGVAPAVLDDEETVEAIVDLTTPVSA